MSDWPMKGTGTCACKYERAEDFGEATITEECCYHARQTERLAALDSQNKELREALTNSRQYVEFCSRMCAPGTDSLLEDIDAALSAADAKGEKNG